MISTINEMKQSLTEDKEIVFVSANSDYEFRVGHDDEIDFLNKKTLVITRKSGNKSIINLELIIGICTVWSLI